MLLIKNANVYSPKHLGTKDILTGEGKILAIENKIEIDNKICNYWDAAGKTVTPGFIDQHIHITGAGGKNGFASMTPEIMLSELIACGSTTVVGLLGTDGTTRSIKNLYAKVKSLESEGLSAFMFTGYYGIEPTYITNTIQDDMIFIDKVLGCKIAITDIRSSYPTDLELLRMLRQITVGGMIANKKGILHLHLGNLKPKMDILFKLVQEHEFPIKHISPTHVGRTKALFDEAIAFAKLGGMIDITTGASKYTDPYKAVLYAIESGISIDKMTFSSDGNAGLDKLDENGKLIGFRRAPIDQNYKQVKELIASKEVAIEDAIKLITLNPATNLGLKNKGIIEVGVDADFCCLDNNFDLIDVFAKGKLMMENKEVIVKGNFE
ncbi:MAG: beta-aspartyl-peptidase [Candidatus Methylacidiphilales bacterium]